MINRLFKLLFELFIFLNFLKYELKVIIYNFKFNSSISYFSVNISEGISSRMLIIA